MGSWEEVDGVGSVEEDVIEADVREDAEEEVEVEADAKGCCRRSPVFDVASTDVAMGGGRVTSRCGRPISLRILESPSAMRVSSAGGGGADMLNVNAALACESSRGHSIQWT